MRKRVTRSQCTLIFLTEMAVVCVQCDGRKPKRLEEFCSLEAVVERLDYISGFTSLSVLTYTQSWTTKCCSGIWPGDTQVRCCMQMSDALIVAVFRTERLI